MRNSTFKARPCSYCGGMGHSSLMCQAKPRRALRPQSVKTRSQQQATNQQWFELNPPTSRDIWYCYLQITPECWYKLTRSTITLEHVKPRSRYPELKYDVTNLKPACQPCNAYKGSRDLDEIAEYAAGTYRVYGLQLMPEGD